MTAMQEHIAELRRRRAAALAMGGQEKVARQHDKGKLTARERIDLLLDPGTFQEYGMLASHKGQQPGQPPTPGDGVIVGVGYIEGRPVSVIAEDATVLGGSSAEVNMMKRMRMIELASRECIPMICMLDGVGARAQAMADGAEGAPWIGHFVAWARQSGRAPMLALIMGPCAGEPALEAAMMEYSIMVKGTGMLAAGGPPIVKASTGVTVSKEELGGTSVHVDITGTVDNAAQDDVEAIAMARRVLSYLPTNAWCYPPGVAIKDARAGAEKRILKILPDSLRSPYDMRDVIDCLVDEHSFFETKPDFGKALLTGFARLNGHSIGLIANQPMVRAGAIESAEAIKVRKFIDLCNAYHVPLLSLTDTPGVMTGPTAEKGGSLKYGLAAAYALAWANVPIFTVILRKSFGFGGALMAGFQAGQTVALVWPTVDFTSLPPDSAIQAAHAKELEQAEDREAMYAELMQKYSAFAGPYPAAATLNIDDVIAPDETRRRLIRALELSMARRNKAPAPQTRHGVMP